MPVLLNAYGKEAIKKIKDDHFELKKKFFEWFLIVMLIHA